MRATKTAKLVKTVKLTKFDRDLREAERELRAKYRQVIRGTLRAAGAHDDFPTKRSAEIRCQRRKCGKSRRVATSDLFQVHFCSDGCKKGK